MNNNHIMGWHRFEEILKDRYKKSFKMEYSNWLIENYKVWLKGNGKTETQIEELKEEWFKAEVAQPIYSNLRELRSPKSSLMKDFDNPETLIQYEQRRLEYCFHKKPEGNQHSHLLLKERSVILGRPGAGKSHFLKHLALYFLQNKQTEQGQVLIQDHIGKIDLPIYVDLQKFVQSGLLGQENGLLSFVALQWQRYIDVNTREYKEHILDAKNYILEEMRKGHVLLLLDELDKTKEGDTYEQATRQFAAVVEAIDALVNVDMPDFRPLPVVIVIAKRHRIDEMHLPGFESIGTIEDLRLEDMRTFVERHGGSPDNTTESLSTLDFNPRLQAFAANPDALRHTIQSPDMFFSRQRSAFYKRYIEAYLTKIGNTRAYLLNREIIKQISEQIIEYIAWEMHIGKKSIFQKHELKNIIRQYLKQISYSAVQANSRKYSDDIFDEVICSDGFLIMARDDENLFRFPSITMQEYFAAGFLFRHRNKEDHAERMRNLTDKDDLWWKEVALLYLYLLCEKEDANKLDEFIKALADIKDIWNIADYLPYFGKPLLAGRALGVVHDKMPEDIKLKLRITLNLYDSLRRTPQTEAERGTPLFIREHISCILADLKAELVTKKDLESLAGSAQSLSEYGYQDLIPVLQKWAAIISSEIRLPPFILPSLIKEEKLSAEALQILYELHKVPELDNLTEKGDFSPADRVAMFYALGVLGKHELNKAQKKRLTDESLRLLEKSGLDSHKICAVKIMGMSGDTSHLEKLYSYMQQINSSNPGLLQWHIVGALGQLGIRLGFWGTGIAEKFRCLLVNRQVNPYARWHIAIILVKMAYLHDEPSALRDIKGEPLHGFPPIAYSGMNILTNGGTSTSFDEFFTAIDESLKPNNIWIYLYSAIPHLTNDAEIFERLETKYTTFLETRDGTGSSEEQEVQWVLEELRHYAKWHFKVFQGTGGATL